MTGAARAPAIGAVTMTGNGGLGGAFIAHGTTQAAPGEWQFHIDLLAD